MGNYKGFDLLDADWHSVPGDTIRDYLEEREWVPWDVAKRSDLTEDEVRELIHGRVKVTARIARELAKVFPMNALFWLMRERMYMRWLRRKGLTRPAWRC